MQWSDIQFRPADRTLRQFAVLWILFFGAISLWVGFRGGSWQTASLIALLAAAGGLLGLLKPQAMRPIYVSWMVVAFPIGWAISKIILAVLFYGLFTPIGLLFRLRGRDQLGLHRPAGKDTYWTDMPPPQDVRRYFNQS